MEVILALDERVFASWNPSSPCENQRQKNEEKAGVGERLAARETGHQATTSEQQSTYVPATLILHNEGGTHGQRGAGPRGAS